MMCLVVISTYTETERRDKDTEIEHACRRETEIMTKKNRDRNEDRVKT